MLLRSSSTPVLGSLLSSLTDSSINNHHPSELHSTTRKLLPSSTHKNSSKLLCMTGEKSNNFSKSLLVSPLVSEIKGTTTTSETGLRRVQSEGSLEELANGLCNVDEFTFSEKLSRKTNLCSLDPFKYYDSEEGLEVEKNGNQFRVENLVLEEVRRNFREYGSSEIEGEGKLYLATGLGVLDMSFVDCGGGNGGGRGGGGSCLLVDFYQDGGDHRGESIEEHYKRKLDGDPGNPLFLRNYAQFLYEMKGDLAEAEEYYFRAALADPEDGEILTHYGKLIWEVHRDRERSANCFERSVQASPRDSHVQAAYARFLWDTEDEEEDDEEESLADNSPLARPLSHKGIIASVTV